MHLLALIACENGPLGRGEVATYDVTLNVVTPSNQAPFDGLDRLVLRLDHSAGAPEEYELESTTGSPQVEDLSDLDGTRLTLVGYSGELLVSYGTTQPVTAHDESIEETVLVTEVGSAGWFASLDKSNALGALAPDGNGSFFLFGGDTRGYWENGAERGNASSAILRVDVAPPAVDLAFTEAGTIPQFEAKYTGSSAGHIGHSATLLTGGADDAGLILLAGGHTNDLDFQTTSNSAFLWDPATGEAVPTENNLRDARTQHIAIELQSGDVLLAGGWGAEEGAGYLARSEKIEVYRRNERSFEKLGDLASYGPFLAGASLGSEGALICGGAELPGGNVWNTVSTCQLVQGDTVEDSAVALEISRAHHQMVPVGDGRAMVIGGVSQDDPIDFLDEVSALASAVIYDIDTEQWSDAGDLNIPRAAFAATTLADGRVLVIGGNSGMSMYDGQEEYGGGVPIACAELWTEGIGWELLDGCSDGDAAGSLPSQVWWPTLASDPVYGVLVVGGLDNRTLSTDGVTYFAASPEM